MSGLRSACAVVAVLLLAACLPPAVAWGQLLPDRDRPLPQRLPQPGMSSQHLHQLTQIDQLIRLGYHSRAHALLEELVRFGAPEDEILRRRIQIAAGTGDHAQAAAFCRQALARRPDDPGLWRELAAAQVALGDREGAREALQRFLELAGEPRSSFAVAVDLLQTGGACADAVALVDSARTVLQDPRFLSRARALCLLRLDEPAAAAREVQADLQSSPLNLQILRRDLLGGDAPPLPAAFISALVELAAAPQARPELALLAANIALTRGQLAAALGLIEPRLVEPRAAAQGFATSALQNASVLVRELTLVSDPAERRATTDYLLALLPRLIEQPSLSPNLRQRACDHLAETCLFALERDLLADDPRGAVTRFGQLLSLVQQHHPESAQLYAAQIQLARFTRDRLRDPLAAAARLERLLLDLDLPLPGVALARLTLGETYLAARDSLRARQVLTRLGRDIEFRDAAGHAHFLLAKLDLAQGHFATARDRFAAVALDSPAAPYANDALGLGLLVAEELLNPTGGLDLLARYARSLWWQLAAEPDSQRVALERYLARAVRQVDQTARQPLLEHARWELAELHVAAGRYEPALAQLERVVLDLPHGRLAPRALARRGEILADLRRDEPAARREYERLLIQYPEYLFADEVRLRLRSLP
jgi:tetratricopeptide (TPR) repeat protein